MIVDATSALAYWTVKTESRSTLAKAVKDTAERLSLVTPVKWVSHNGCIQSVPVFEPKWFPVFPGHLGGGRVKVSGFVPASDPPVAIIFWMVLRKYAPPTVSVALADQAGRELGEFRTEKSLFAKMGLSYQIAREMAAVVGLVPKLTAPSVAVPTDLWF